MNEQEIKSIYLNAEKVISFLESPSGKQIRQNNPKLYDIASKTLESYRDKYYTIKLQENEAAKELVRSSEEAMSALKIIPSTSHEAVAALNNLITKNSEKLQNELLFNSETYYEKYFFTLSSTLVNELSDDVLNNPRFKDWFGNSKVINSDGNPLLVYHGTGGSVEEFSKFKFTPFPGAYFAVNKSYSDWFAKSRQGNEFMFRCYLRVQNPIDLTPFEVRRITYGDFITYIKLKYGYEFPENKMLKAASDNLGGLWAWQYLRGGVDWLKFIKNAGEFDGFYYYENNPNDIINGKENVTLAWLVLDGNQIKTADVRNTTYSLFSDDIRMEKGGKL